MGDRTSKQSPVIRHSRSAKRFLTAVNAQTPLLRAGFVFGAREPDDYLLSHGQSALSSAWSRFTVLFGMGRGGTDSLWSSGMTCCCVAGFALQPIWEEVVGCDCCTRFCYSTGGVRHTGYRIKPYGQLVSVSSMHYCTYTPDLSTSWSGTTLQGARSPGDISS